MSDDISSKVKKIVADHLGIDEAKVTEESSFIDDLGADSLDTVELVMAFEEEFGLEIPDDEAENITTIKSAVDWIEKIAKKSFFLILTLSFIIIFLKLSLEYNFLTTASALKRGPLPTDKILLAVVFPEAKEPVMPTFIIILI